MTAAAEDTSKAPITAEVRAEYEALVSSAVDILPEGELLRKLARARHEGRPLRIKYGADPSAPDIHLGHAVPVRKLRQFQEFGHQVVFIIGGYTARIGDPSGRNASRPRLTAEQVKLNAATYLEQVFRILDREKTEIVDNADWLEPMTISDVLELTAQYTVSQMLERDDFHRRFEGETPIFLHEFLYPLLQGYDSIAVRSDVEIGGTDQKFNLLVGRELQRARGMDPQCILTMPLLVGLDGQNKMSKSLGNYIGVTENPRDMFGKTMSLPDNLMGEWYRLLGGKTVAEAKAIAADVSSGALHPRAAKEALARSIVAAFHGETAADAEVADFRARFSERQFPTETADVVHVKHGQPEGNWTLARVLAHVGAAKSNRESKTLLEQKSVKIFASPLTNEELETFASNTLTFGTTAVLKSGEYHLKIGKARFIRLMVED